MMRYFVVAKTTNATLVFKSEMMQQAIYGLHC